MARPKPDYLGAAKLGMARAAAQARADKIAAARPAWDRIRQIQEAEEERRMVELAAGIHTEELLQQMLSQIPDETMRAAVEARIRPFTKIPVPIHE